MLRYDDSNNAIIGFKFPANPLGTFIPAMRIYYHYFQYSNVAKFFDFKAQPIASDLLPNMQFNRFILTDRMIDLPSNQQISLPVTLTDDRSFVHAGVGIATRFEIPFLKNLYYLNGDIRILDARIEIEPAENTYNEFLLPERMSLITTDDLNRWGSPVYTKGNLNQTGNLVIDMLNQEDTRYSFDVTNFLITRLEQQTDELPALLLTVSSDELYKTTQRLILGSQHHNENKVKLKIYYMNVNVE
jgi:hypothetical protein